MQGPEFDELAWFERIHQSGARALLIGRRALVVLGLPVLTADYDFWIAIDDIVPFNEAASIAGLSPTHAPDEARRRGRYALENDEHVDVLVAREVPTMEGTPVRFEDLWGRRRTLTLGSATPLHVPSIDDLILTKRFVARPKDLEDIRLLTILKEESQG